MTVGDFVWYDLVTTDPGGAVAFYRDVVGWKTQPFGEGADPYLMWVGAQGPLGGVMALPPSAAAMGAPPHWFAHVTVADVDATVERVKALGAKVYKEPADVPTVGRFAIIADPQGASLSVFTPASDMKRHDAWQPGEFCWNELATTDHHAAFAFYAELFGWSRIRSMDLGPMGTYELFGKGAAELGGMFTMPSQMPRAAWLYYVSVDDLEAAVARAKAAGGTLMNGPMDVPGGRVAQLSDPQGAFFALHSAAKR